jgi:hypothetical protein
MGAYCVLRASNEGIGIDRRIVERIENALIAGASADAKTDFYRTYFQASALREAEGVQPADSLGRLRQSLTSRRQASGPNKGSWDPRDQWGSVGGRIYSTALAALSLERETRERL